MTAKKEFSERLQKAMRSAGYEARPAVLEREFNERYWGRSITFQTASAWLRGASVPTQEKLEVLAVWLRVEPQALRYGEDAVARIRERKARWDNAIHHEQREVFEAFLALPVAKRKIVREVILAFAASTPPSPSTRAASRKTSRKA